LFEGKLTLDDILTHDLAFLHDLVVAKQKQLKEKEKARDKAMNEATSNMKKSTSKK